MARLIMDTGAVGGSTETNLSNASRELQDAVLMEQAHVCADRQEQKAGNLNLRGYGTGITQGAIHINSPKSRGDVRVVSITFKGSRTRGNTTTRNAEIAFYNEYGVGRRMEARGFISKSNEEVADQITEIAATRFAAWVAEQIQI